MVVTLKSYQWINIMKLNDRIVNQALKFREEGNDDDITSITIKI